MGAEPGQAPEPVFRMNETGNFKRLPMEALDNKSQVCHIRF